MRTDSPKTIYLKDYQAPAFFAEHCDLTFEIFDGHTYVTSKTRYAKNTDSDSHELCLNGEEQELVFVKLDGDTLSDAHYRLCDKKLIIKTEKQHFKLEIKSKTSPETNTALEGLYKSGDTYCTQCEAEGFRRITYYIDRPDNMATFTTRIEADKKAYPVLLSNGNLLKSGDLDDGRHYTLWEDPWKKPCYLFALVAGDLKYIEDHFETATGRDVTLRIYVRDGDQPQCDHAMESLKKSMKWDEDAYGREYDLDLFNIVAVSDFNMGAMENKSLNIFNTALVLAQQETATDTDFIRVESVVAHEYFHNWSGNRVTCRDWFQLSLKEGLTVFRDQEFSADMNSRAVQRIDDVAHLRNHQFPEDGGPLAHPIRPDNYIEINNFYTMTVYEKGAEVIRMLHTILGAEKYRKGTDLYFDRHDGDAATCEDFVQAMEDASGIDLSQFRLWYSQAGTPEVTFKGSWDEAAQSYKIELSQHIADTPNQANKKPMHIPVNIGLLNDSGDEIKAETLHLTEAQQEFSIEGVSSKPVPSILRNFSAPVKLTNELSDEELAFLLVHDSDGFSRWEAGQAYMLRVIKNMIDSDAPLPEMFFDTYGGLLERALDPSADKALMARAISLPGITRIAQDYKIVDPDAIHSARESMLNGIVERFSDNLRQIYTANRSRASFEITPDAMGKRLLQNTVMLILCNKLSDDDSVMALEHYNSSNNMTDRMAALFLGCALDGDAHQQIVGDFYTRFKDYQLVIDKWFSAQAQIHLPKTHDVVSKLRNHPDFNIKNPNRVRSLYAAFAMMNPVRFHSKDGKGYDFLTNAILELNTINPQIAARLLTPMREWRRYDTDRQDLMQRSLEKILAEQDLSKDVYEIASKSLKG